MNVFPRTGVTWARSVQRPQRLSWRRPSGTSLAALAGLLVLTLTACSTGSGSSSAPGSPGNLLVSPRGAWLLSAVEGSAPGESTKEYTLTNEGSEPLDWLALSSEPWVGLSSTGGQLAAGASTSVIAGLDEATVAAFAAGTYAAELEFHDLSVSPAVIFIIPVSLTVIAGQSSAMVTPPDDFLASGSQGGPFAPESKTYAIENTGNVDFRWSLSAGENWIQLPTPASGSIVPGGSVQVQVSIHQPTAAGLQVGVHTGQLTFNDDDSGVPVAVRGVVVEVFDTDGWTQFTKSADTRTIYVSSSQGNDGNDGLSEATPKRTLGAGLSLLRSGYPDWLLLKRGDTFNADLGSWSRSGRSTSEPMLVSSYGNGERPRVRPSAGNNFLSAFNGSPRDFAIVDLHIVPQNESGTGNAFAWYSGGGRMLVEGCLIEHFELGFVLQGGGEFALRRNVIVDCTGQGMYVSDVSGLLIEENLFDHLGLPDPDIYKHGIYIDNEGTSGMVVRGNIITDTSSHGLQLRPGGIVEDNLFARNAIALLLGGGDSWQSNPNGVACETRRNVILDARNIGGNQRGWGIEMKNIASAQVTDNILANSPSAGYPRPIIVGGPDPDGRAFDVTIQGNVISGWGGSGIEILGDGGTRIRDLVLTGNEVQNLVNASYLVEVSESSATDEISSSANTFYSGPMAANNWFMLGGLNKSIDGYKSTLSDPSSIAKQVSYPNAGATIGGYHGSLGKTATHEAFITEARKQSRDNWRPEYTAAGVNAWIRAAFED